MTRPTRVFAALLSAVLSFAIAPHARADSCGCGATGAWPPGTWQGAQLTSAYHGVSLTGGGTAWELKLSGGGASLDLFLPAQPGYSFYDGDTRFEVTYLNGGIVTSAVYALDRPGTPLLAQAADADLDAFVFSPMGRFMTYGAGSPESKVFHVMRAEDGVEVYTYNAIGAALPEWGPDDRSFWYSGPVTDENRNVIHPQEAWLVNAVTFSLAYHAVRYELIGADYSPCGDLFELYSQPDSTGSQFDLELHDTYNGGAAASATLTSPWPTFTDANTHYYEWNDGSSNHTTFLANNTAGQACPANIRVASASAAPTTVVGGQSVAVTVTLAAAAPSGGASVAVSASPPYVGGAIVTVPAGTTSAVDSLPTLAIAGSPVPVTLTASGGGASATTSVTLFAGQPALTNLSITPGTLAAGGSALLIVNLGGAAVGNGDVISLTSSDPVAFPVPANITVTAGGGTGGTTVITPASLLDHTVTVTATAGSVSLQRTVQVQGCRLATLVSPDLCVVGGTPEHMAVELSGIAPGSGADLTVGSSDPAHVPAHGAVHIAADSKLATFDMSTATVSASTSVTLSSSFNGATRTFVLTLLPAEPWWMDLPLSLAPAAGSPESEVYAINASGALAGESVDETGRLGAYVWVAGTTTAVPPLNPAAPAASVAWAINDSGIVVGTCGSEAFRWDGVHLADLGTGEAYAVNAAGHVAGYSGSGGGGGSPAHAGPAPRRAQDRRAAPAGADQATAATTAFLYDGAMHALGTLGGSASEAFGVNASDVVVGWALDAGSQVRAFKWTSGGGMQDLGAPTGMTGAFATAINGAGVVAGYAVDVSNQHHACTWDGAGAHLLDAYVGEAWAINDSGQVAGWSNSHPVSWDHGTRTQLDALPIPCGLDALSGSCGPCVVAYGINAAGQVAGTSFASMTSGWRLTRAGSHVTGVAPDEAGPRTLTLQVLGPNPVRGALALRCTLADLAPARVEVVDLAGRRVAIRNLATGALVQAISLPETATLAPGLYFARLEQGGRVRLAKVTLLR